jgi:ABC-type amino acid transport substrate-binding protein
MSRLFWSPLLPAVSTETGDYLLGSESCGNAHLAAMSFLSLLRSLTHHTACVSFIRFFKSAIFVSKFLSSSLKVALSFCSLLISSIAVPEFGAYSTIRALECLSLTSSVETFSSSPARYRSFSSVPPYIDTGNQLRVSMSTYMAPPLHMILVRSYLL